MWNVIKARTSILTSCKPGYINVISWLLILVSFVQYMAVSCNRNAWKFKQNEVISSFSDQIILWAYQSPSMQHIILWAYIIQSFLSNIQNLFHHYHWYRKLRQKWITWVISYWWCSALGQRVAVTLTRVSLNQKKIRRCLSSILLSSSPFPYRYVYQTLLQLTSPVIHLYSPMPLVLVKHSF